jgi:hypothetical protein
MPCYDKKLEASRREFYSVRGFLVADVLAHPSTSSLLTLAVLRLGGGVGIRTSTAHPMWIV